MELYVGLDVSLKETSICVVDGDGNIVSEGTVLSEPEAIAEFVKTKAAGAKRGTVRLKFWAFFNRLIVVENHWFSARFMGSLESHFQPNWR